MKTKANNPVVVALVLWLLFCAANAFAMLKSPYPRKTEPPGQIIATSDSSVDLNAGTACKPK